MIRSGADSAATPRPGAAPAASAPRAATRPVDGREEILIAAAVDGDQGAFGALYDLHIERVYRYCYYRTGNRPDAEDLTQETFMHAWRAIRRYRRGGAPFAAWLLAISHNVTSSHFRKPREVVAPDVSQTASDWGDPVAALAKNDASDAIRAAIGRLRRDHQRVILLRFVAGYSAAEVAATLGTTDNNVRVIQHRALARLRSLLSEQDADRRANPPHLLDRLRRRVTSAVELVTEAARHP
jgi:RNA polymerase sigma-70 factor (ECF subfamily)